ACLQGPLGLTHHRGRHLELALLLQHGAEAVDGADVLVLDGAGGDGSAIGRSLAPADREADRQRKDAGAEADLAAFAGADANGEWQLLIADDRSGASGSLEGWSLSLR
ncbi:MAG TPA: proprotein convertase P-domain-containing protein, partial [Acidimicrobiales bacterium]|nr:proprotein convertase P-domain-containing protein [Acidimicrobiales bacterium]